MAEMGKGAFAPMTELFDFLTERGVLSALYLASLLFPLAYNSVLKEASPDAGSLAIECIVLSLILSKLTYEFLLDIVRKWTTNPVIVGFRDVTSDPPIADYKQLRRIREGILGREVNSGQQYLKDRILKDESLRHTTTYMMCANFLALFVLILIVVAATFWSETSLPPRHIIIGELLIVIYVLIATLVGEQSRSKALGRSVAHAHVLLATKDDTGLTRITA